MTRIITAAQKIKEFTYLKDLKQKKIIAYGHFSSIHPGHIRYLQNARSLGDVLIVVIKGDKNKVDSEKYFFSINERSKSLAMLNICDYIVHLENEELHSVIEEIKPDCLVFGTDYKNHLKSEIKETVKFAKKNEIEIIYNSGEIKYATTELLEESNSEVDLTRRKAFFESCKKQLIDPKNFYKILEKIKNTPILIIGDNIIDEYTACEALGMSAEAPVLVVKELDSKIYCGGAAVVASHIKSLGGECYFITVSGNDHNAEHLKNDLEKKSIKHIILKDKNRPTTYKKRYMVENQKLFRVSKLDDQPINKELEKKLLNHILKLIPKVKGIVFSDFNYGVISEDIIKKVTEIAHEKNILLFADSQSSTQMCSITKFKKQTLLCPNEKEARISLQNNFSGLESLVNDIFKISKPKKLIMKLGGQGFIAYEKNKNGRLLNQHFPALSSNPADVAGAGDSLLAFMALSLSAGIDFMEASAISCFMCMLAVESIGNKSISDKQLLLRIKQYL